MLAASRRGFSGSTVSIPSGAISSPRWAGAGVTIRKIPPGASTRAVSPGLRGPKTLMTIAADRLATGSGPQTSAPTAAARG